MILNKDINPEYNLYHVGSHILEALIDLEKQSSFSVLYRSVYSRHKTTVPLFSLALDWLYIIEAIQLSEKGEIKCLLSH